MTATPEHVTQLLEGVRRGDAAAADELLPLVYQELRRIAAGYLRRERRGHTLQPTALVHEAYVRMLGQQDRIWQNRAHFVGIAARMMRRILVDHARRRRATKRDAIRVTLDENFDAPAVRDPDLVALDDALRDLETIDPQLIRIVELRYFGGLTTHEAAEVLGVSLRTLEREWATAKAWLRDRLGGDT
jgi:RNA polymerase sigma-70 factor, ECF subfamily